MFKYSTVVKYISAVSHLITVCLEIILQNYFQLKLRLDLKLFLPFAFTTIRSIVGGYTYTYVIKTIKFTYFIIVKVNINLMSISDVLSVFIQSHEKNKTTNIIAISRIIRENLFEMAFLIPQNLINLQGYNLGKFKMCILQKTQHP